VQFDAVFATSDVGAMSAIATLANKNIRVPKHIKIVGYDNIPLSAFVHPTLTTIDQPIGLAALAMVDLLNEKWPVVPAARYYSPPHWSSARALISQAFVRP